jgi:glycosyltransferase involved in cell wall biosynthesis
VQRFAEESLRELVRLRPDVTVLVPSNTVVPGWLGGENTVRVGRLRGHAWEQIDLPRYLARRGSPLLLSLASTAPMRYRNQICTHHDITYVRYPTSFSPSFRLLYRVIVPRMLRSSQSIITVSEFSRSEIASHYGVDIAKISVVPNAADDRFRPDPGPDDRPYFLGVSSPNEHKNFQRLLAAYEAAQGTLESDLVIIGQQTSSFVAQQYDVAESTRVNFTGRVSDEELVHLYQHARAFVFPSLYEGFGIPPLEAQQCGIPVASSNAASLPEVLGDSVLYFDPRDVSRLGDVLTQLDSDPDLRSRLREAGYANAARYSWEKSASQILSIVDQVVESGPAGARRRADLSPPDTNK